MHKGWMHLPGLKCNIFIQVRGCYSRTVNDYLTLTGQEKRTGHLLTVREWLGCLYIQHQIIIIVSPHIFAFSSSSLSRSRGRCIFSVAGSEFINDYPKTNRFGLISLK